MERINNVLLRNSIKYIFRLVPNQSINLVSCKKGAPPNYGWWVLTAVERLGKGGSEMGCV